jgi:hypothetical protein
MLASHSLENSLLNNYNLKLSCSRFTAQCPPTHPPTEILVKNVFETVIIVHLFTHYLSKEIFSLQNPSVYYKF